VISDWGFVERIEVKDGMTDVEILEAYPQLKLEDIHAALAYAAEVMRQELLLPVTL
jgi:uncharacterized protein (DUF433 family)